ncbi:hypothetical protein [Actinomadura chokoriensis]|uniref:Uncharacterized protein n=1 Tax=Actinomadura chokoriensis TaxID=454156 RepID=A0ABV4R8Y5_9ACTN
MIPGVVHVCDRFRHGPTPIEEDRRWRTGLPRAQRAATTLVASPLMRRYGYGMRS